MKVERLRKLVIRSMPPMIHWRKASFSERLRGDRYTDAEIQDVTSMNEQGPEDSFYLVDLRNGRRGAKDISRRDQGQHGLEAGARDRLKPWPLDGY